MNVPLRVIKVGGSLLEWPELFDRFHDWLALQPPAANVIVVGGGAAVDILRDLDQRLHFLAETVHWAAIRLMDANAEWLAARLCAAQLVKHCRQLDRAAQSGPQVLCVTPFLREDVGRCGALPIGWEVTSDSIAARVAAVLDATELVLLKSTSAGGLTTPKVWSEAGLVDSYFSVALAMKKVRFINLREVAAVDSTVAARNALS